MALGCGLAALAAAGAVRGGSAAEGLLDEACKAEYRSVRPGSHRV